VCDSSQKVSTIGHLGREGHEQCTTKVMKSCSVHQSLRIRPTADKDIIESHGMLSTTVYLKEDF
jgi:hypothetical protein